MFQIASGNLLIRFKAFTENVHCLFIDGSLSDLPTTKIGPCSQKKHFSLQPLQVGGNYCSHDVVVDVVVVVVTRHDA